MKKIILLIIKIFKKPKRNLYELDWFGCPTERITNSYIVFETHSFSRYLRAELLHSP